MRYPAAATPFNLSWIFVGITLFSFSLLLSLLVAIDVPTDVEGIAILLPLAYFKPGKSLNDGNFYKKLKLNLLKFYHKIYKTSPNSDLNFYNNEGNIIDMLGLRLVFKDECYRVIALFVLIVLISAALIFFFNLYDLILFIFLILISNLIIIKANSRELLKLYRPWSNVCLSVACAITDAELSDSCSSEICDNRTTDSGDASGNANVKPLTDHKKYDYDHTTNSIVMRRTGEITSLDPIENSETASSSGLISSKYDLRKPLETIKEEDESNYDGDVDEYEGESEGPYGSEAGSDDWSNYNIPSRPPTPDSAMNPAPGYSSSDIEIEGPFYSSDEEQAPKPPSVDAKPFSNILLPFSSFCFNTKFLKMLARVIILARLFFIAYSIIDSNLTISVSDILIFLPSSNNLILLEDLSC
jgi:hypothetical protein